MKSKFIISAIVSILLCGCASPGKSSFTSLSNTKKDIVNEVTINNQYSETWDKLVRELSKSFYVINNIDKESRIINVSFSTESPDEYIDCGRTRRTFSLADMNETYDYAVADSSTYKYAIEKQFHPSFADYSVVNRKTTLEGRANIYIAPNDKNPRSTNVSVNTRYIFKIVVDGAVYRRHAMGNTFPISKIDSNIITVSFNTNTIGETKNSGDKVTCSSRGKFESEVLEILK